LYDQPAGRAVRASLTALASTSGTLTDADIGLLRERITIAVAELKANGWPVERIIIRLKEVAKEVGFPPSPQNKALSAVESDRRDVIWTAAIKQCIEEYYGQEPPSSEQAPRLH
jgi:hypothetical protein